MEIWNFPGTALKLFSYCERTESNSKCFKGVPVPKATMRDTSDMHDSWVILI